MHFISFTQHENKSKTNLDLDEKLCLKRLVMSREAYCNSERWGASVMQSGNTLTEIFRGLEHQPGKIF